MTKNNFDLNTTKPCLYCKEEKPLSEFPLNKTHHDGHDNRCKVCKAKRFKEVAELRKTAPPITTHCECCGKEYVQQPTKRKDSLCLDHDPVKGTFRGWICRQCNTAIGLLGDNLDGVKKAVSYLQNRL